MRRFLQLLNLRRNEVPRLSLAALIFFLVAVDDGIVKSVSSGVFNIRVGPERLPEMYSWIAVLFSVTMVGLSWLTTRVRRQRLVFSLFGVLAVLLGVNTLALWVASAEGSGGGFYPFLFVSSELIRNIAGFQVWIVAGGICYTSRAKVLFPLLAASTTLGDIGGGFLVRAIGGLLDAWQVYALAALNTVIVVLLLRPLMRRYFVAPVGGDDAEGAGLGENLRYFAGSAYLRLLFILSLVLFALYTAIHYGFNVVARQHYPAEGDITAFFGLFFGLAGIATLVTTTLLLRHLLRWLGVGNVYLWVCAVHVAAAALLAVVFGGTLSLPAVPVILLVNLLNYVLLDAVIAPTYQVLMKLVPERHSDGTRMIMEGGFMLLGGLLGAGVTVLHARGVVDLGTLFALLLAIGVGMVIAGWRLRQRYRDVLVQAVREQDVDVDDEAAMREVVAGSAEVPRGLLLHQSDGVREMGIEILRRNPQVAQEVCLPLLDHDNPRIRTAARQALAGKGAGAAVLRASLPGLDDGDAEVRLSTARLAARAVEAAAGELPEDLRSEILDAVGPRLVPDAGDAALQSEFLFILESLHDGDSETARELILDGLLTSDTAEDVAAGVDIILRLGQVGQHPGVFDLLDHGHPAVREAAVRAVSCLATREASAHLVRALADPDPDVVSAAVAGLEAAAPVHGAALADDLERAATQPWKGLLQALVRAGDEAVAARLLESCRQRLLGANRALVAAAVLRPHGAAAGLLADQLELECRTVRDAAVGLLGELGDVGVVADLVERIHDDNPGARDNAVELLENIASRSLLEPLLPLLADDEEERLEQARRAGGWGPAQPDLDAALALAVEDTDPWTCLAGAWAARCLDRPHLLARLPADAPDPVKEIASDMEPTASMGAEGQPLTNMEKITLLKESPFFAALPLEELYHIAQSVQEETVPAGTCVIEQASLGDKMYIVVSGELEVRRFGDSETDAGVRVAQLTDKQVFGDMALLDDEPRSASVIALTECRLLSLERGDLERILRRYSSIAFSMMRILSRRLRHLMAA